MEYTQKCVCGGTYLPIDGLEGLFCDKCGCQITADGYVEKQPQTGYSEEKMKTIRGVPVNRIIMGSESKGRLEISMPIFLTYEDQKHIVDQQIALLEYTLNQIKEKGLDIMTTRRKTNDSN